MWRGISKPHCFAIPRCCWYLNLKFKPIQFAQNSNLKFEQTGLAQNLNLKPRDQSGLAVPVVSRRGPVVSRRAPACPMPKAHRRAPGSQKGIFPACSTEHNPGERTNKVLSGPAWPGMAPPGPIVGTSTSHTHYALHYAVSDLQSTYKPYLLFASGTNPGPKLHT